MLASLFAIYMSEYMLSLICMDKAAYALEGAGEVLHYLKMPALAIGFLMFPLSWHICTQIRTRRLVVLISNILFIFGMMAVMGFFASGGLYVCIISSAVSLLSLGFLGGAVYFYFAMGFVEHPYMGRLSGAAGAVAFIVQMGVSYHARADIIMLIVLLAGFAFMAYITISSRERFEWMFDEPLEYAKKGDPSLPGARTIAAGVIGMFMIYMICGLTDTIIVSMNFAGDMSMYDWPRLFGAVGYLVGGFLADIGRRKWILICAVCMAVLSIPLPILLREDHIIFGTCLYYIIAVSQLVFLNMVFWDIAPKTSHPQLVAGLGRILACAGSIIIPAFSHIQAVTGMIIQVIFTVVIIVCIAAGRYFPESASVKDASKPDAGESESPSDNNAKLREFANKHRLTPRETDMLIPLIKSDDDVQVIAANMNISARTVYRHINSIYEKTGTETRYALMRYYYESK